MKRHFSSFLGLVLTLLAVPALATLNVFASVPEWAALAEELGGDQVKVYATTNAWQDPHHVEAKPSLIARARSADLVIATGAELEVGWLPLVLRQAGNPRVQPGQPGYLEATAFVSMLEKPLRLDRADGDVHPAGNPHIQLDPRNIARVAAPPAWRISTRPMRRIIRRATRHSRNAGAKRSPNGKSRPRRCVLLPSSSTTTRFPTSMPGWDCSRWPHSSPGRGSSRPPSTSRQFLPCCNGNWPGWSSARHTRATGHRSGSPNVRRSTPWSCPSPLAVTIRQR